MRLPGAVSPTGKTIYKIKIPLVATSRVPNAVALSYTARAVMILGVSTCAPITFFVSGPKFIIFSLNVLGAVIDHLLFRFLISQSVPEIFAIKV